MLAALVLAAAAPAGAQGETGGPSSFRIGRAVQLDVRVKAQFDWRDFPKGSDANPSGVFDLHRARAAIDGTLWKRVEFQVERELRKTDEPWRDVYLDVEFHRALQVKSGRFKIPFSLDEMTGGTDLDFAYRSLAATYLAPGRDLGVMVHGTVLAKRVKYHAGAFRQGGENIRPAERRDPQSSGTLAGRVTVRPWQGARGARAAGALRGLAAGASFTSGEVPEGLNSLRGRTVLGEALFPRVYVNGGRRRTGAEVEWRAGPVSVRGELMRSVDERRRQGTDGGNLPDAIARGWYWSGTWLLTGEPKKDEVRPAKPLLQGGAGAVELAARLEEFRMGSRAGIDPPSVSPRAGSILETADRVLTFGLNWYLNPYVLLQVNAIRETRERGGTAVPGQERMWSRVLRAQFEL